MLVQRMKVILTAALVFSGAALGLIFTDDGSAVARDPVFTLDFGNYDIKSEVVTDGSNANEILHSICNKYGYLIEYDSNGDIKKIDGKPADGDSRTWGLYTQNGNGKWLKQSGKLSDLNVSGYAGVSWSLCDANEKPTSTVDYSGFSYYGLKDVKTIVSLAPSCTETICELGGEDMIIGTDRYSNYPASVQYKRNLGIIAETGSYTSPSFETIVKLNPDLVIGISSQSSHLKVANKLREVGMNAIIVEDGKDLKTVYDNTYITGVAMGQPDNATYVTQTLKQQVEKTYEIVSSTTHRPSVMVSLSTDKSPYVAGVDTYISDVYSKAGAKNAFTDVDIWRPVNSEKIAAYSPEIIIVLSDMQEANESNYQKMLNNLEEEWKQTKAYANGKIYMFSDSASDMLSRPSTRLAQLTELMGRICHESAFSDSISIPMYLGDNYTDYLTYSKELGTVL